MSFYTTAITLTFQSPEICFSILFKCKFNTLCNVVMWELFDLIFWHKPFAAVLLETFITVSREESMVCSNGLECYHSHIFWFIWTPELNITGDEVAFCTWTHPGNFNPLNLKALVQCHTNAPLYLNIKLVGMRAADLCSSKRCRNRPNRICLIQRRSSLVLNYFFRSVHDRLTLNTWFYLTLHCQAENSYNIYHSITSYQNNRTLSALEGRHKTVNTCFLSSYTQQIFIVFIITVMLMYTWLLSIYS